MILELESKLEARYGITQSVKGHGFSLHVKLTAYETGFSAFEFNESYVGFRLHWVR